MAPRFLLELAGYQAVWWISALGAARGLSSPGILAAAMFLALQAAAAERPAASGLMAVAAGLTGLGVESVLAAQGQVRHAAPWPSEHFAPAWIVMLWAAFGATLGTLRRALGQRPYVAGAVLGAVLGPASYLAGAGIGALRLGEPTVLSVLSVAVSWGAALPMLLLVSSLAENSDRETKIEG